jgi:hypothetical protein
VELVCIQAFGNFRVGNVVEVPAGAVFDHTFFEQVVVPPAEGGIE